MPVSVLIPAYRADKTLAGCVESILAQELDVAFEVVVVVSADREADLPSLEPHPRLKVQTAVPRLGAAIARNRALTLAGGELLVFTDADVVAPAGWLATLVAASWAGGDADVLAGSVRNGTPRSVAGTVEYLVQFSSLAPSATDPGHGATCNLLVPRACWVELGPFPEDMDGGEDTLLTVAAREQGRFRFVPTAPVVHQNRTAIRDVLAHQRDFGRFTAQLAERCPALPNRRWLRSPALVPVATAARAIAVGQRSLGLLGSRYRLARHAPMLLAALLFWGAGLLGECRRLRRQPVRLAQLPADAADLRRDRGHEDGLIEPCDLPQGPS